MKYSQSEYTITEKVDRSIRNKISDLRVVSGTKYAIYTTLITTYGVVENSVSYTHLDVYKRQLQG